MTTTNDRELWVQIAKDNGWSIERKGRLWELCYSPDEWCILLDSEKNAEDYMLREDAKRLDSVDAAFALPWPVDSEQIVAWRGPKTPGAVLLLTDGKEYHAYSQPTLARALCEVFAQWWKETHHE